MTMFCTVVVQECHVLNRVGRQFEMIFESIRRILDIPVYFMGAKRGLWL